MKLHFNNYFQKAVPQAGMTLIEVIVYMVLLSLLMTGFIKYAFAIHMQNIDLQHDIEDAYTGQ